MMTPDELIEYRRAEFIANNARATLPDAVILSTMAASVFASSIDQVTPIDAQWSFPAEMTYFGG